MKTCKNKAIVFVLSHAFLFFVHYRLYLSVVNVVVVSLLYVFRDSDVDGSGDNGLGIYFFKYIFFFSSKIFSIAFSVFEKCLWHQIGFTRYIMSANIRFIQSFVRSEFQITKYILYLSIRKHKKDNVEDQIQISYWNINISSEWTMQCRCCFLIALRLFLLFGRAVICEPEDITYVSLKWRLVNIPAKKRNKELIIHLSRSYNKCDRRCIIGKSVG